MCLGGGGGRHEGSISARLKGLEAAMNTNEQYPSHPSKITCLDQQILAPGLPY